MHFWVPLLTGLSRLTSDARAAIRKGALEVLFNILKDHGHLFPQSFWIGVFDLSIFPIFSFTYSSSSEDTQEDDESNSLEGNNTWESDTNVVAAECLTDVFVHFFDLVRLQLHRVVSILVWFIRSPGQHSSNAGVAAVMRLAADLRSNLSEEEWREIFFCLKAAAGSSLPAFTKLLKSMSHIDIAYPSNETELSSPSHAVIDNDIEDNLQTAAYIVSRMKSHIDVQLLIMQVVTDLYKTHWQLLSLATVNIILELFSFTAAHAHELNSETILLRKIEKICSILEISDPPKVHFENESYKNYLNFLHDLPTNRPFMAKEESIEAELVDVCEKMLQIYLDCAGYGKKAMNKHMLHGLLPLRSSKKEELEARTPLVLSVSPLSFAHFSYFKKR